MPEDKMHPTPDGPPVSARLTVEVLQRHNAQQSEVSTSSGRVDLANAIQRLDTVFVESVVRAESAQQLEHATFIKLRRETYAEPHGDHLAERIRVHLNTEQEEDSVGKLYSQSGPSSMSPMQRFALVSSAVDPFVIHDPMAKADDQRTEGAFNFLQPRTDAAISIAAEAPARKESSMSAGATTGSR